MVLSDSILAFLRDWLFLSACNEAHEAKHSSGPATRATYIHISFLNYLRTICIGSKRHPTVRRLHLAYRGPFHCFTSSFWFRAQRCFADMLLGGGPNWSLIIGQGRAHGKSSTRHILSKRREESQILNPNLEKLFSHIVSQSDLLQHGRRLASASIQSVGEPLLHQSKRDSCHLNRCGVTRLQ